VSKNITALEIKPGDGTVSIGTAIQLRLFATTDSGGTDLIPASMAVWSSSNGAVAEVNRQGRLSPRRPGTATLTAAFNGKVARAVFTAVV
jgi:hypothetical protein